MGSRWLQAVPGLVLVAAGCRPGGGGGSAAAAPPSAWRGVHFVCAQWSLDERDILIENTGNIRYPPPEHPAPPALLRDYPPRLETLRVPGLVEAVPLGWSADGVWLALAGMDAQGRSGLYGLNGPGARPRLLVTGATITHPKTTYSFSWAPVGARFFLADSAGQAFIGDAAAGASARIGTAGHQRTLLPPAPVWVRELPTPGVWSDDAGRVAFLNSQKRLVWYDLGRGHLQETQSSPDRFVWAPNGHYLLVAREPAEAHPSDLRQWRRGPHYARYAIIDTEDGSEAEATDRGQALCEGGWRDHALWSPDGRLVAIPTGKGDDRGLLVCDARGQRVVSRRGVYGSWWRADGGALLSSEGKPGAFWSLPLGPGDADPWQVHDCTPYPPYRADPHSQRWLLSPTRAGGVVAISLETGGKIESPGITVEPVRWHEQVGDVTRDQSRFLLVSPLPPSPAPRPGGRPEWRAYEFRICQLPSGTVRVVRVDVGGTEDRHPAVYAYACYWSPDGRVIVFRYIWDTLAGWAALDIDTGKVTRLSGYFVDWMPAPGC